MARMKVTNNYFKGILTERLNELLDGGDKTVSDMTESRESFPDPSDRATLESERTFSFRIKDRELKLIVKIKEAIQRIDDDTYGICEVCEEEIAEKRLEARPVTTLCIECKTEQEVSEKIKGM